MISLTVMTIFILAITFILVKSCDKKVAVPKQNEIIDKKTSSAIKGVAILIVYIHHFGQLSSPTYNSHTFLGYLGVSAFMFIAGYVSEKQLLRKGIGYLSHEFLVKKVIRLYVPFIIVTLTFGLLARNDARTLFLKILHIENDWFLTIITVFYILFFVLNKIFARKSLNTSILILFVIVAIFAGFCFSQNTLVMWYNTAFAFPVGAFIGLHEKRLLKELYKKGYLLNIILILIFTSSTTLAILRIFPLGLTTLVSATAFSILITKWTTVFVIRNKLLEFIGLYSWEFYLIHTKILSYTKDFIGDITILYCIIPLLISIIAAVSLNKCIEIATKKLYK